ncbi:Gag-Pol polyprotein [Clarias magur]|uniref:Gag-Pol polyprotein n=1 Tax=Clarias magur TaxID=1594786 RepID=A0A8J4WY13_CLAMG|nr:Gag-Pol polyprotein [Clarias magur]
MEEGRKGRNLYSCCTELFFDSLKNGKVSLQPWAQPTNSPPRPPTYTTPILSLVLFCPIVPHVMDFGAYQREREGREETKRRNLGLTDSYIAMLPGGANHYATHRQH